VLDILKPVSNINDCSKVSPNDFSMTLTKISFRKSTKYGKSLFWCQDYNYHLFYFILFFEVGLRFNLIFVKGLQNLNVYNIASQGFQNLPTSWRLNVLVLALQISIVTVSCRQVRQKLKN
jgi:hypothetical protein